jgi:hypothetical protein
MTDAPERDVVERLQEAAQSIRVDGTPAQVGLSADEHEDIAREITRLRSQVAGIPPQDRQAVADELKLVSAFLFEDQAYGLMDIVERAIAMLSASPQPPVGEEGLTISDYEKAFADHKRLVRNLDVLLNGEVGAAPQASLCDLVAQLERTGFSPPVSAAPQSGDHWQNVSMAPVINFSSREDGGLRIWSDDIPGLILSHADPAQVLRDLGPAIGALLKHNGRQTGKDAISAAVEAEREACEAAIRSVIEPVADDLDSMYRSGAIAALAAIRARSTAPPHPET